MNVGEDDNVIQFPIGRVGNTPAPSDEELVSWLLKMRENDATELESLLAELKNTDADTQAGGEPEVFVYARLMNYLGNGINETELMHMCAAAVWQVYGQQEKDGT